MIFFIIMLLAVFVISFLIMTAVQLIRIEKGISNTVDLTEAAVKRIYGVGKSGKTTSSRE